jgi:hypothetical protein
MSVGNSRRFRLLALLCAGAAVASPAQEPRSSRRERLQKEDIRAAAEWLRRNDPFADHFTVLDKRRAAGDYSLLVLRADPDLAIRKQAPEEVLRGAGTVGIFLVHGATNQIHMVLDLKPLHALPPAAPEIAHAGERDAVLDLWGDYNMYLGSIKYVYDIAKRRITYKLPFFRLIFRDSTVIDSKIYYLGLGKCNYFENFECRDYALGLEQFSPDEKPRYELTGIPKISAYGPKRKLVVGRHGIRVGEPCGGAGSRPPPVRHPDLPELRHTVPSCYAFRRQNAWFVVWNEYSRPPGYDTKRSGVFWIPDRGSSRFYPVPTPDVATWRRLRRAVIEAFGWRPEAMYIHNHIGPFAREEDRLWFAGTFYDGEGHSGVGNLGWFDLRTRSYHVWYPPELAPWSATALLVEKESIWIGLAERPEGAPRSGGIVRYDRATGQFSRVDIPAVVHCIDRFGDALYVGTSGAIYVLRDDVVSVLSVEPVAPRRWDLVVRRLELSP